VVRHRHEVEDHVGAWRLDLVAALVDLFLELVADVLALLVELIDLFVGRAPVVVLVRAGDREEHDGEAEHPGQELARQGHVRSVPARRAR
jgi:hypothetical protein